MKTTFSPSLLECRDILSLFADLVDYPSPQLPSRARSCGHAAGQVCSSAQEEANAFALSVEALGIEHLEEIYTRTFDVTPATTLYVGYHLFGDSYKRGSFLVALQEAFGNQQFSSGRELADHLSPVLRFASIAGDPEFVYPLLREAVLPAVGKIAAALQGSDNPYGNAVRALKHWLENVEGGALRSQAGDKIQAGGLREVVPLCENSPSEVSDD